jgi:hypothetical protein
MRRLACLLLPALGLLSFACTTTTALTPSADGVAPDVAEEPADEEPGTDAGAPAKDAGKKTPAPSAAPTPAPAPVDPFPAGFDQSCGYGPIASPDGNAVVYERCAATTFGTRPLVHRNLVTGTITVLSPGGASWWREPRPEGLLVNDGKVRLIGWDGVEKAALPSGVYVADSEAWRVRITGGGLRFAGTEALGLTNGTHDERFQLWSSASATAAVTANFAATYITVPSVVFSQDLGLVASLERYSSGLTSRLRVADVGAGAAVRTYELPTIFEPRWVKGGGVGSGAIFVAQRKLYHANFITGALTPLSTTPAAPNTQQLDRVYAVVSGTSVFFAEGKERVNGSGAPGAYTIKKWDSLSPQTAPATVSTGTDYLNAYADVPMRLSPDGAWLLANFEPPGVIAGSSWHVIPVTGGVDRVFAKSSGVQFTSQAIATWNDYQDGTHVEALDQSKARTFPKVANSYTLPFVGADGQTILLFQVASDSTAKTSSWRVERTGFTGVSTVLLDLPASSRLYAGSPNQAVPVLGTGLLVRIPKGTPDGASDLVVLK